MEEILFDHNHHREMWLWLADHPEMIKEDWPGWEYNGGEVEEGNYDCFACEYSDDIDCKDCPLIWPKNGIGENVCDDKDGLFTKWEWSTDLSERSQLARQIANLPVRKGVKTK